MHEAIYQLKYHVQWCIEMVENTAWLYFHLSFLLIVILIAAETIAFWCNESS